MHTLNKLSAARLGSSGAEVKARQLQYGNKRNLSATGLTFRNGAKRTVLFFVAVLLFVMAGATFLVVSCQGAFNHRIGRGGGLNFVYLNNFAFELLVILEKSSNHG